MSWTEENQRTTQENESHPVLLRLPRFPCSLRSSQRVCVALQTCGGSYAPCKRPANCYGTSEDSICLADGAAGSENLSLGGSRTRDMIRLLTQTYENTNKGLWVTRDLRDNNELYVAHMLRRKEDADIQTRTS